jgi:hypothetical protein
MFKSPCNLDDCLHQLVKELSSDFVESLKETNENIMYKYHHTLGRNLRNEWNLWTSSELSKWFCMQGIYHADDMSGIILTSLYRLVNNIEIDVRGQIEQYEKYWLHTLGAVGYTVMKEKAYKHYVEGERELTKENAQM